MSQLSSYAPAEHFLRLNSPVTFESGEALQNPVIAYQTWGNPEFLSTNVVWVCHALTGNHRVHEWWSGLFGEGKIFDPENCFIVCVNVPSSCYGTSGPVAENPENSLYTAFPKTTIRDAVAFLEIVRNELGVEKIHTLIGASLGGQQALEWTVQQPDLVEKLIPIATNAKHSPFGIAFNEAQRLAIQTDPTFYQNIPLGGQNGMIAARAIGMLSYRTYRGFELTQSEETIELSDNFKASSYQKYQGEKLARRFNAYSYWYLSKMMDSHNLGRGRGSLNAVLKEIKAITLVIGVDSDLLFPISEQQFLADTIPGAELGILTSDFGHDGFLVEFDQLNPLLNEFLTQKQSQVNLQSDEQLQVIK